MQSFTNQSKIYIDGLCLILNFNDEIDANNGKDLTPLQSRQSLCGDVGIITSVRNFVCYRGTHCCGYVESARFVNAVASNHAH